MKSLKQLFILLSSLRLTVILLAFSLVLVFFGTLDQVKWGIRHTQEIYFETFIVMSPVAALLKTFLSHSYDASLDWLQIPLPGGYTLGGLLLINLLCAHFRYFKLSWKKSGITIMHFGVLLLLVSGFLVSYLQEESVMTLDEGAGPVNHTSDFYNYEIFLADTTDPQGDRISSIPVNRIKPSAQSDFTLDGQQGLTVRVLGFMENSGAGLRDSLLPQYEEFLELNQGRGRSNYNEYQWRQLQNTIQSLKLDTVLGVGLDGRPSIRIDEAKLPLLQGFAGAMGGILVEQPKTFAENEANAKAAVVEIISPEGQTLGLWILSSGFGPTIPPQTFTYKDREYELGLRSLRYYLPFSLSLVEARHDLYPGTQIPRNFSSQVIIDNAQNGENRQALIYMNNPLRYGGLTFYQYQMQSQIGRSILQVVRNPSWLVPYIAVGLVGLGMMIHFSISLLRFARRSDSKNKDNG